MTGRLSRIALRRVCAGVQHIPVQHGAATGACGRLREALRMAVDDVATGPHEAGQRHAGAHRPCARPWPWAPKWPPARRCRRARSFAPSRNWPGWSRRRSRCRPPDHRARLRRSVCRAHCDDRRPRARCAARRRGRPSRPHARRRWPGAGAGPRSSPPSRGAALPVRTAPSRRARRHRGRRAGPFRARTRPGCPRHTGRSRSCRCVRAGFPSGAPWRRGQSPSRP